MNNPESQYSKPNSSDVSSECIPAASHYALKLAFQSLKERFDKLQSRFNVIEEENVKLKEHVSKNSDKDSSRIEILEKRIDDLSRQKSQLSHHIFMLANENKSLWDSISNLTEEKQILLDQIRDFDGKLKSLEIKENIIDLSNHQLKESDAVSGSFETCYVSECEKESMHSIETLKDFSLVREENVLGIAEINDEMKGLLDKLNTDKAHLLQQQEGLKKALENMKKLYLVMKLFTMCLQHLKNDNDETSMKSNDEIKKHFGKLISYSREISSTCQEFVDVENSLELKCPFCCKLIVKSATGEENYDQFLTHVQYCSDIDTILKSFEVIV